MSGPLFVLLMSACSYHGVLRSRALSDAQALPTAPEAKVTLSTRLDGVSDLDFTVFAVTFNYDIKEAYFNAARATLESIYGRVDEAAEISPGSTLFAVPYFKATTTSTTSTSATIETLSRIDVYEGLGGKLLRSYQSTQQVNWSEPTSAKALGFVTGLTLLALAPITIPIALQIEGNHGRDLLEKAIRDSFSSIGTQLAQDRRRDEESAQIDACFRNAAADPSLASLVGRVALDDFRNQTFEMLANTTTPTDQEKRAIRQWDALLASCYAERDTFMNRWNVPAPLKALVGETKTASQNLRVLLYRGGITYGEYAKKRREIGDAFVTAQAKIENELAEQSAEAQARANLLAMQAQQTNLAQIQARQMEAQTLLMGLQTINQATAISQQNQQHRDLMNQQNQQQRELVNELNRPRTTSCQINRYNVNCTSW